MTTPQEVKQPTALVVFGYLAAVLLPLIGLIIGLVLYHRRNPHGVAILWISVILGLMHLLGGVLGL